MWSNVNWNQRYMWGSNIYLKKKKKIYKKIKTENKITKFMLILCWFM